MSTRKRTTSFTIDPDEPYGYRLEVNCPTCNTVLSLHVDEIDGGYEVEECDNCTAHLDMFLELVIDIFPKD